MTDLPFPLNIITERSTRPDDIPDTWALAFKATRPDLTTKHGFRWYPGTTVRSDHNLTTHDNPCPTTEGDGLCLANTLQGASSGGHGLNPLIAVWYDPDRIEAQDDDKLRISGELRVGDIYDITELIRNGGADLAGAYLGRAYLGRADLGGAYLGGAYLGGAYLGGADLAGADLAGAYLGGANLGGAYLGGAYLGGANLAGANLGGANLGGAYLAGAKYDQLTIWPQGFDPAAAGAEKRI